MLFRYIHFLSQTYKLIVDFDLMRNLYIYKACIYIYSIVLWFSKGYFYAYWLETTYILNQLLKPLSLPLFSLHELSNN